MSRACGKIILFGEHAVVFSKQGVALPVQNFFTEAAMQKSDYFSCSPDRILSEQEKQKLNMLVEFVFSELNLREDVQVSIKSTLPMSSGFGSSASLSVALIRECSRFFRLKLSKNMINSLAYRCESIFHSTPSGIDNSVIAYEKPVYFHKKPKVLELEKPLEFVVANTGKRPDTATVVKEVRRKSIIKDYMKILSEIGSVAEQSKKHLIKGDNEKVGMLMNKNHLLLKRLGVSSPRLDLFCEVAVQNNAYGAKLSGAGKGGNMIALVDQHSRENIMKELSHLSDQVIFIRVSS